MWFALVSTAFASCFPAPGGAKPRLPPPAAPFDQEARIDGLVARWRAEPATSGREATWIVQLEGETTGWLVFGTNGASGITGAELFFGWVDGGESGAAHHKVLAPGRHVPATPSRVTLLGSSQIGGSTTVRLRIPAPQLDADGGTWLVLAWSRAPELDHHSARREHVYVRVPR